MRTTLLFITILLFASCTKHHYYTNEREASVTVPEITGKWAIEVDTTQWAVIGSDTSVYFPKHMPQFLDGLDTGITIKYYISTESKDVLMLKNTQGYPSFMFYKSPTIKGMREAPYLNSQYSSIKKLF